MIVAAVADISVAAVALVNVPAVAVVKVPAVDISNVAAIALIYVAAVAVVKHAAVAVIYVAAAAVTGINVTTVALISDRLTTQVAFMKESRKIYFCSCSRFRPLALPRGMDRRVTCHRILLVTFGPSFKAS